MDLISRADAKAAHSNKYFTGEPCKNGHVAYRYTQSGACSDCVRSANPQFADPNTEARRLAKLELVTTKLMIDDAFLNQMRQAIWGYVVMRYPCITLGDVCSNLKPVDKSGTRAIYRFEVHPLDIPALQQLQNEMLAKRPLDVNAIREKIFGKFNASVQVAEVPDWARVPRPGDFDYGRQ